MAIKDRSKISREIEIDLQGPDGNAYVLFGIAKNIHRQLTAAGIEVADNKTYNEVRTEMMSGDYENVLACMEKYYGNYITMYR